MIILNFLIPLSFIASLVLACGSLFENWHQKIITCVVSATVCLFSFWSVYTTDMEFQQIFSGITLVISMMPLLMNYFNFDLARTMGLYEEEISSVDRASARTDDKHIKPRVSVGTILVTKVAGAN